MRLLCLVVLVPSLLWPARPQRVWQHAFINKIERNLSDTESVDFGHRTVEDAWTGPVVTGIRKISVVLWIVTISSESSLLTGAYERTKLPSWLRDQGRVKLHQKEITYS